MLSLLALPLACLPAPQGVEVPLRLWTDADWPGGLDLGLGRGVSFGDYDADGWPDLFTALSGRLLHNEGGRSWRIAADLSVFFPPPDPRYGAAFGDYDADGLPDIATEPRGGGCSHLLRNLGNTRFLDVSLDPEIIDEPTCGPGANCETNCWADVDGDRDLDLFLPIYPAWAFNGRGNAFYRNLGPTGPGGAWRLEEYTHEGGFENPPPDSARPEGAMFCDVDVDGDLDLYSNGTLYQNRSAIGVPRMLAMSEHGSGIGYHDVLDEGALLADYDMDGDFDLYVAYTAPMPGAVIWENRGDGTFFQVEAGVIQNNNLGLGLGLSIEDWDGDGDMDFTTKHVFRRNQLVETGQRSFTVATHAIPDSHLQAATPAWGDWDRDGDLDCALGNHGASGWLYENTTFGPSTPLAERRALRVRPVADSASAPRGLEIEYGAAVRLDIAGDDSGHVRRKLCSSSAGYTTQSEYDITFGLPADPLPEDPEQDLVLALRVDFPSHPDEGLWRVDASVNPWLGAIPFASLAEHEVIVWRSGRVRIGGVDHLPCPNVTPRLLTSGGGLALPDPRGGLPRPTPAVGGEEWIGLDFDTIGASEPVLLRELVLDGSPAPGLDCGGGDPANLLLYELDDTGHARLASGGALELEDSPRNDRSEHALGILLERERHYRIVARMASLRASRPSGATDRGSLRVRGGLRFAGDGGCPQARVEGAIADPEHLYLALRFSSVTGIERYCLAADNSTGAAAELDYAGSTSLAWNQLRLSARGLPPHELVLLLAGQHEAQIPFGDGWRCLAGKVRRASLPARAAADGSFEWQPDLAGLPIRPGSNWSFQAIYLDAASSGAGFNASDGLRLAFCP